MRRHLLILTVLLLLGSHAIAADYVAVDYQHGDLFIANCPVSIGFSLTYECPNPESLAGISLPFSFSTTGDCTFDYVAGDYELSDFWDWFFPGPSVNDDWLVGMGKTSGKLFFGGPLSFGTITPGTTTEIFSLDLRVYGTYGSLCIDSSHIDETSVWSFNSMTCGEGGAPERPLFLDASLSDENHPICAYVETTTCLGPVIDTVPDGDMLSVSHCSGASFDFGADPVQLDNSGEPVAIIGWEVVSGPGTIDDVGYYTIDSQPLGVYDVTIEVLSACCGLDEYTFQVEFTNDAPSFVVCPITKTAGIDAQTSIQLNATDNDACDQPEFSLVDDGGQANVTVTPGGLFSWNPTPSASGIYSFVASVEDGAGGYSECEIEVKLVDESMVVCGDADASGNIDIDDVVLVLAYVFRGGPPPAFMWTGDVNCVAGIDVDDVVYLFRYVFQDGNDPCDPDGDGIPDC